MRKIVQSLLLSCLLLTSPVSASPETAGGPAQEYPPAEVKRRCAEFKPGNVAEPRPMALFVRRKTQNNDADVFACIVAPPGKRAKVNFSHILINTSGQPWSAGGTRSCSAASEIDNPRCKGTNFILDAGSKFIGETAYPKLTENAVVQISWVECDRDVPWSPECRGTLRRQTYLLPPQEIAPRP